MSTKHSARPMVARAIRLLSIPIILGWLIVTAVTNTLVPQLEMVGKEHSVSLSPLDAPALIAMKRLGSQFQQFDSDSMAMIVLESDQPLGDEAHRYTTIWSTSWSRTPNTSSTCRTTGVT